MEVSKLNLHNTQSIQTPRALNALQHTDSPTVDTLSSNVSNEQGCCAQILDIVTKFIHWIASFFYCSTSENLETLEGIKEYMACMDACFDQEDGPVVLLKDFVRVFELPLQNEGLKANHTNVFSFIIHTITSSPQDFENNKTSNLYRTIHEGLEANENNLALDFIISALGVESIDSAVSDELISIIENSNLSKMQKEFAELPQRLLENLLLYFNSKDVLSPINLIERMTTYYDMQIAEPLPAFTRFHRILTFEIDILHKDSRIQTTTQSNFYLTIGTSLLETDRLDQTLIFQKCEELGIDITEMEIDLTDQIGQFNNRESIEWNKLVNQYRQMALENFNDDKKTALCFAENKLVDLVMEHLIAGFQCSFSQEFPNSSQDTSNALALIVHILQTNETIKDSRLKQFYLSVGEELVRTGKLNEEKILRQCNPPEEMKPELVRIIREFNQKEVPDSLFL